MSNVSDLPDQAARPLRQDAVRSQEAVLSAARALYAERGLSVGFDEIARRAGVGTGTVYRRFPDRHSLLSALFEDRITSVNGLAQHALEAEGAWEGLEHFIVQAVAMFSDDRGLREIAFDPTDRYIGLSAQRERLASLLTQVTDRAHRERVLRDDCSAQDVASIIAMLSRVAEPSAWASDGTAARCTTFVLAGIRVP